MVFATDIEWRSRIEAQERAFLAICREPRPADLLVIDAHFAEADAKAFAGWGHTCWEDALDIAQAGGIDRVLLGHHDPEADDITLLDREQRVKDRTDGAALARAGQWITLSD